MTNKTFKYRLYPKSPQEVILKRHLEICRNVYNELLQINIATYDATGKHTTQYMAQKDLKFLNIKTNGVYAQVVQYQCYRVDRAFKNFFRGLKEGKRIGFPRFKTTNSYKSITYPQHGFKIQNSKLHLSKIGGIRIFLHRPIEGKIKTCTIVRKPSGKWFACFSCDIETKQAIHIRPESKIGIDVGLESLATLSDGIKIKNPRFLKKSERRLKFIQRRLSRKQMGSNNRKRMKHKTALLHERIANQRHDYLHKLTYWLTQKYGEIHIEDLNVQAMVHHPYLAKSITDASWGTFAQYLTYKAESAGCKIVKVSPGGTSQNCSQCKIKVPKTLAQRWHICPNCGLRLDRDINAARNIMLLQTATDGLSESNARGEGSSPVELALQDSLSKKRETRNGRKSQILG